ncbi:MAG: 3-deoxy-manno-octulosonate cytidylyltransferase [Desulfatibacillaceae bacterium]
MRVVVLIPSRYGSTRFPGKPLAPILGKPMIQWVVERARAARSVSEVAVATDDPRIEEAVASFGCRVVMTSTTLRSGTDRVHEAARKMGLAAGDIVVNVQGDQPVFAPECIDQAVAPLKEDPAIGMSTMALAITREKEITDPKDVKVVFDQNGFALYFSRSPVPHGRDEDSVFDTYKHLGIYAYTMDFLEKFAALPTGHLEDVEKLEQLRALEYGLRCRVVVTEQDSPEVDLPEDVPWIEGLIREGE